MPQSFEAEKEPSGLAPATKIILLVAGAVSLIIVGLLAWSIVTRDNWEANNSLRVSARLEEAERVQQSDPWAAYKTYDEVLQEAKPHKITDEHLAKKLADAEKSRTALYAKVQGKIRSEEAEKRRLAEEEAKRAAEEKQRIAQEEEHKRAAEEKKRASQETKKIATSDGNSESECLQRACLFREHGLLDDAKRELVLVVTSRTDDSTKARAFYLLGAIAFDQNHIRLALETWRQLAAKYPSSPESLSVADRIKEIAQIVGESQKGHIDNVVAESYLRHADFWSEHKDEIFIIDASWIDHVEAANKWYDRVIREFPKTPAARLAYEEKMRTLLGWREGQYLTCGVVADHDKYIPRVIETFNQFETDFPDAATLPAFRFQIAQAYWRKDDRPNCHKWLNAIVDKAGGVDTFYVDLAKRRLTHLEHKD